MTTQRSHALAASARACAVLAGVAAACGLSDPAASGARRDLRSAMPARHANIDAMGTQAALGRSQ